MIRVLVNLPGDPPPLYWIWRIYDSDRVADYAIATLHDVNIDAFMEPVPDGEEKICGCHRCCVLRFWLDQIVYETTGLQHRPFHQLITAN